MNKFNHTLFCITFGLLLFTACKKQNAVDQSQRLTLPQADFETTMVLYSPATSSFIVGFSGSKSFNSFVLAFGDISQPGFYSIAEASMMFNIVGGTMGDRFVLDPGFDNQLSITSIDKDNKKISGHFTVKLKRGTDDTRKDDKTYIVSANFNEPYRVL